METITFATVARDLGAAAAACSMQVPAFRAPSRTPGRDAPHDTIGIERYPGGVVVSVDIKDRDDADVRADMVLGVLRANHKDGTHPHAAILTAAACGVPVQ